MGVYFDELENTGANNMDIVLHLAETLRTKARYCVMFVTRHYPLASWREAERTYVREHALRDASEYCLPLHLDGSSIPGIQEPGGYGDDHQRHFETFAQELEEKLAQRKSPPGPPAESHDLRSGNLASSRRKPGVEKKHE